MLYLKGNAHKFWQNNKAKSEISGSYLYILKTPNLFFFQNNDFRTKSEKIKTSKLNNLISKAETKHRQ